MCTEPSKPEEYSVLNNFQSYKIPGSILTKWPKLDEIQNDLQVIIDIANFTRVIDVETDEIFKLQMCQKESEFLIAIFFRSGL